MHADFSAPTRQRDRSNRPSRPGSTRVGGGPKASSPATSSSSAASKQSAAPKRGGAQQRRQGPTAKEKAAPKNSLRGPARQPPSSTASSDVVVSSIDSQVSSTMSAEASPVADLPVMKMRSPFQIDTVEVGGSDAERGGSEEEVQSPLRTTLRPALNRRETIESVDGSVSTDLHSALRLPSSFARKNQRRITFEDEGHEAEVMEEEPRKRRVIIGDDPDVEALSPVSSPLQLPIQLPRMRRTLSSSSCKDGAPSMTATPSAITDRALERSSALLAQLMNLDLPDLDRTSSSEEDEEMGASFSVTSHVPSTLASLGNQSPFVAKSSEGMSRMASTMSLAFEQNDVPVELLEVLIDMWMKISEGEEVPEGHEAPEGSEMLPYVPATLSHEISSLQKSLRMMSMSGAPSVAPSQPSSPHTVDADAWANFQPGSNSFSLTEKLLNLSNNANAADDDEDPMTAVDSGMSVRTTATTFGRRRRGVMCRVPVELIKVLASFWQHLRSKEALNSPRGGGGSDAGGEGPPKGLPMSLDSTKSSAGSARSSHESYDSPSRPRRSRVSIEEPSGPVPGACPSPLSRAGGVALLSPRMLERRSTGGSVGSELWTNDARTDIMTDVEEVDEEDLSRVQSLAAEPVADAPPASATDYPQRREDLQEPAPPVDAAIAGIEGATATGEEDEAVPIPSIALSAASAADVAERRGTGGMDDFEEVPHVRALSHASTASAGAAAVAAAMLVVATASGTLGGPSGSAESDPSSVAAAPADVEVSTAIAFGSQEEVTLEGGDSKPSSAEGSTVTGREGVTIVAGTAGSATTCGSAVPVISAMLAATTVSSTTGTPSMDVAVAEAMEDLRSVSPSKSTPGMPAGHFTGLRSMLAQAPVLRSRSATDEHVEDSDALHSGHSSFGGSVGGETVTKHVSWNKNLHFSTPVVRAGSYVSRQSSAPMRARSHHAGPSRSIDGPVPHLNIPQRWTRRPSVDGVNTAPCSPPPPPGASDAREIFRPADRLGSRDITPPSVVSSGLVSRVSQQQFSPKSGLFRPLGRQSAAVSEPLTRYSSPRDGLNVWHRDNPLVSARQRPGTAPGSNSHGSPNPAFRQVSAPVFKDMQSMLPLPPAPANTMPARSPFCSTGRASSAFPVPAGLRSPSAQGQVPPGSASRGRPQSKRKVMRKVAVTTIYTFLSDY